MEDNKQQLNFLATEFGEYIDKEKADAMFDHGGYIERQSSEILKGAIKDKDGKDYYASPAFAFIFSYSKIKQLWDKMTPDSCLVLLKGARAMERDGKTISNGRPTLIAMVYHEDGEDLVLDQEPLNTQKGNDIGSEHPGGYPPGLLRSDDSGIPIRIRIGDIVPYAME